MPGLTGSKVFVKSGGLRTSPASDHECGEIPVTAKCQSATILCNGKVASFVEVKKSVAGLADTYANIVEIEVYGVPLVSTDGSMNLALHRPVTVSSEWGGHSRKPSEGCHPEPHKIPKPGSLVTDGVTKDIDLPVNTGYWSSCKNAKDDFPTASIDLGIGPVGIGDVVVHNRCCCTGCECDDKIPERGGAGNGTNPGC